MPLSLRGLSADTVELGFESYFNLHFSYNSEKTCYEFLSYCEKLQRVYTLEVYELRRSRMRVKVVCMRMYVLRKT